MTTAIASRVSTARMVDDDAGPRQGGTPNQKRRR